MHEAMMPRERAAREGLGTLEDRELLALLLGTGHGGRAAVELADDVLDLAADRSLTATLCNAGEFLDLPVLDHVIVGGDAFVSFADQGWLT